MTTIKAEDLPSREDKDMQTAFLAAVANVCEKFSINYQIDPTRSNEMFFAVPHPTEPGAFKNEHWGGIWVFFGHPIEDK